MDRTTAKPSTHRMEERVGIDPRIKGLQSSWRMNVDCCSRTGRWQLEISAAVPEATSAQDEKEWAGCTGRATVTLDSTYRSSLRYGLIRSFAGKRSAAVFRGHAVRGLPLQVQPRARAKLLVIDTAVRLDDLRSPPSNRLEAFRGDRRGQHSIRINDQWRICFVWRDGEA